ncbi:MAG: histidine ammonia-lyase [Flavobacteriales bacterium]|nr:histidine ammonia-lyase [Flavobacteriales bacterium]
MSKRVHKISDETLTLEVMTSVLADELTIELSEASIAQIVKCRTYLDEKIKTSTEPIYGVTTGFGSLYKEIISDSDQELLQVNLIKSHAAGVGEVVPDQIVKLMIFLKIQSLSYGYSGISLETIERLIAMFNSDVIPVVYQQGSLGASGDLAPLAHMSLPIIGLGEVNYKGQRKSVAEVNKELGWEAVTLQSKEGLALLNGTQFMTAYGFFCLTKAVRLSKQSDVIAAVSVDAFDGRRDQFDSKVHKVRAFKGQVDTAERMVKILDGSELQETEKEHLQDPYSLRCIPQVHGASKDALDTVLEIFLTEINSVTDNPTIFPDEDEIISAGNFHGQPLAINLDYLCIALAELGSISERRIFKLLSGTRGLPAYLIANPGLNSGFMIAQYTAASVVSQNKQLCTPSSIDTIDSSNGQEDHVSMGANGATKAFQVVNNLEKILAIELFAAAQALEFRKPVKSSPMIETFVSNYRNEVAFVKNDQVMHDDIHKSVEFLSSVELPL